MKIGQVSFLRMTTPADVPYGSSKVGSKYQGQRGPTPSRYWENFTDDVTVTTRRLRRPLRRVSPAEVEVARRAWSPRCRRARAPGTAPAGRCR